MNGQGPSRLLRIFTGEDDRIGHDLLYEKIIFSAKAMGLAGGTVLKGIMSYGASSQVHRAKLIELSEDLPIVIEIIDRSEKIDAFLPVVEGLMEQCAKGGLITVEHVEVVYYQSRK
jgi:PII-like signaling protein